MDSKIGSDIAKLLGTLNANAKNSASKSIAKGSEGASFKQTLLASESARTATEDGKPLPVSEPLQAASRPLTPAVKSASRELASGAPFTVKQALRDFDLVVLGDQTEESAVLSFAQQSGMSAEALSQLFAIAGQKAEAGVNDVNRAFALQAVDGATIYSKLESLGLLEKVNSSIAAALAKSDVANISRPATSITGVSEQLTQVVAPALERTLKGSEGAELLGLMASERSGEAPSAGLIPRLSKEIESQLRAVAPDLKRDLELLPAVSFEPASPTRGPLSVASTGSAEGPLSVALASMVVPSVVNLLDEASVTSLATMETVGSDRAVQALVAQLKGAVAESIKGSVAVGAQETPHRIVPAHNDTNIVVTELATTLAAVIAPEAAQLSPLAATDRAADGNVQPILAERLVPLVERWLSDPSVQSRISGVSPDVDIQPRALSLAIAPQVTQWIRTELPPQIIDSWLALANSARLERIVVPSPLAAGLQAPEQMKVRADDQRANASLALSAVQPATVSDAELRLARSAAVSQPLPVQVSVMGKPMPAGVSGVQVASITPAQVQPSAEATVLQALPETNQAPRVRQATMDRFAMRGVAVKVNPTTGEAKLDGTLKVGEATKPGVETAAILRDLIASKSPVASELQRSIPTTNAFLSGDVVDASANAKLVTQAEPGLARQNVMSSFDRLVGGDVPKPAYPSTANSFQAREMVGQQLSEALGHRLAANLAAGHYRLRLNVHPKELGAVDVVMEMRDGRLEAQISSTNAVTRELLADSLPRLRDALQQNGIQLAQLSIGSDSQQGGERGRGPNSGSNDEDHAVDQMLADASGSVVEDLDLDLDLDTIDFWA